MVHVKMYVKADLFAKRKFIIKDSELEYSQASNSICRQCLQFCNMVGTHEHKWWDKWKKTVRDELTTRRNHCQNYCKDAFMGKSKNNQYSYSDIV